MTENNFEQEMRNFDYSVFSKVKNSLLDELLQKQRADNMKNFKSLSQTMREEFMTEDELDYIAAAGNPSLQSDISEKNQSQK